MSREFGGFVQEEDAVMGEVDLAGPQGSVADHAGGRHGVVGRAKRAMRDDVGIGAEQAGGGVDAGDLEGFVRGHRGQNRGEALGQHRFAAAWRPHEKDVVGTGGRDFQRAPSEGLSADVGEIDGVDPFSRWGWLSRRDVDFAAQPRDKLGQVVKAADVDAAGEGGLRCDGRRQQDRASEASAEHGDTQCAANWAQLPGKGEFADRQGAGQPLGRHEVGGREDAKGEREVQPGALLADVGGREIHDDALSGKLEASALNRGPYAFGALFDGVRREPDNRQPWQPPKQVDFDLDGGGVGSLKRCTPDCDGHGDLVSAPAESIWRAKVADGAIAALPAGSWPTHPTGRFGAAPSAVDFLPGCAEPVPFRFFRVSEGSDGRRRQSRGRPALVSGGHSNGVDVFLSG